jgi:hypothetical protein
MAQGVATNLVKKFHMEIRRCLREDDDEDSYACTTNNVDDSDHLQPTHVRKRRVFHCVRKQGARQRLSPHGQE